MDTFAKNLKRRAEELVLSNAEVARRVGLSERRYAHYASGRNEPDLATLIKIAETLKTSPNDLLLAPDRKTTLGKRQRLELKLAAAASAMTEDELRIAVAQSEAILALRQRRL